MYVAGLERGVRPIGDWSMSITLSRCSMPVMRSCGADRDAALPFSPVRPPPPRSSGRRRAGSSPSLRMSLTSELLPEPLTPVTQTNSPSGMSTSMFFRLLWRAPWIVDSALSVRGRRCSGTAICLRAGEVLAGEALRVGERCRRTCPAATTSPPRTPGPGPKSTRWSAGPHRVLVVLDDDDRVAHVAQPFEAAQQPVVVARVQADGRLVEDVEDADQPAADLAGQADPLGLAAGERRSRAVERQVMQADVEQEAEPAADLLEHLGGDDARWIGLQATSPAALLGLEPGGQLADRHGARFDQRLAADADGPGLRR